MRYHFYFKGFVLMSLSTLRMKPFQRGQRGIPSRLMQTHKGKWKLHIQLSSLTLHLPDSSSLLKPVFTWPFCSLWVHLTLEGKSFMLGGADSVMLHHHISLLLLLCRLMCLFLLSQQGATKIVHHELNLEWFCTTMFPLQTSTLTAGTRAGRQEVTSCPTTNWL